MTTEQFEDTLRQFIRRVPFQPFVVEKLDGSLIHVDHPSVAFGGGAASYFAAEDELIEFVCEDVQSIRQSTHETAS